MSAPPTKVRRFEDGTNWFIHCTQCRTGGLRTTWDQAIDQANLHAQTHTAERIADQLDEWAGEPSDNHQDGAYWQGHLEGAAQAQRETAQLIRQHLVKRPS